MNRPGAMESVSELERAGALLNPLRLKILAEARQPASATTIASRLGQTRQKINYHVKALERAGFLRPTEQRRRRNMTEQLYVATAVSYMLDPRLVAPLITDPDRVAERESTTRLLSLAARLQSEVLAAREQAEAEDRKLPTLSVEAEIGFTSAAQRAAFARALRDAVTEVVGRFSAGSPREVESARPYRLLVACHPIPPESFSDNTQEAGNE